MSQSIGTLDEFPEIIPVVKLEHGPPPGNGGDQYALVAISSIGALRDGRYHGQTSWPIQVDPRTPP